MPSKKKPADTPFVNVLVTIEENYHQRLDDIVTELRSAGLKVKEVYRLSGVIAGSVARDQLSELQAVEGVASVENEPIYHTN
jgi:hypothetical protein